VYRVAPSSSLRTGGVPIFVSGDKFINTTQLKCRFGRTRVVPHPGTDITNEVEVHLYPSPPQYVDALYIRSDLIICVAPLFPSEENITIEVTNNDQDYSDDAVRFEFVEHCASGSYCPAWQMIPCPKGAKCPLAGSTNFTVCPPGTYQEDHGAASCTSCAIGHYCSDFGLQTPDLCPSGVVCGERGLVGPRELCPRGHYCYPGTKTNRFASCDENGLGCFMDADLRVDNPDPMLLDTVSNAGFTQVSFSVGTPVVCNDQGQYLFCNSSTATPSELELCATYNLTIGNGTSWDGSPELVFASTDVNEAVRISGYDSQVLFYDTPWQVEWVTAPSTDSTALTVSTVNETDNTVILNDNGVFKNPTKVGKLCICNTEYFGTDCEFLKNCSAYGTRYGGELAPNIANINLVGAVHIATDDTSFAITTSDYQTLFAELAEKPQVLEFGFCDCVATNQPRTPKCLRTNRRPINIDQHCGADYDSSAIGACFVATVEASGYAGPVNPYKYKVNIQDGGVVTYQLTDTSGNDLVCDVACPGACAADGIFCDLATWKGDETINAGDCDGTQISFIHGLKIGCFNDRGFQNAIEYNFEIADTEYCYATECAALNMTTLRDVDFPYTNMGSNKCGLSLGNYWANTTMKNIFDPMNRTECDRCAEKMLGYPLTRIIGKSWTLVQEADSVASLADKWESRDLFNQNLGVRDFSFLHSFAHVSKCYQYRNVSQSKYEACYRTSVLNDESPEYFECPAAFVTDLTTNVRRMTGTCIKTRKWTALVEVPTVLDSNDPLADGKVGMHEHISTEADGVGPGDTRNWLGDSLLASYRANLLDPACNSGPCDSALPSTPRPRPSRNISYIPYIQHTSYQRNDLDVAGNFKIGNPAHKERKAPVITVEIAEENNRLRRGVETVDSDWQDRPDMFRWKTCRADEVCDWETNPYSPASEADNTRFEILSNDWMELRSSSQFGSTSVGAFNAQFGTASVGLYGTGVYVRFRKACTLRGCSADPDACKPNSLCHFKRDTWTFDVDAARVPSQRAKPLVATVGAQVYMWGGVDLQDMLVKAGGLVEVVAGNPPRIRVQTGAGFEYAVKWLNADHETVASDSLAGQVATSISTSLEVGCGSDPGATTNTDCTYPGSLVRLTCTSCPPTTNADGSTGGQPTAVFENIGERALNDFWSYDTSYPGGAWLMRTSGSDYGDLAECGGCQPPQATDAAMAAGAPHVSVDQIKDRHDYFDGERC
jgi:hypothetical protein